MNQTPDKSANRSVWLPMAASVALGLCLFAGHGFRISSSVVDFHTANSERHFANPSSSESGVASIEKPIRTQSKTPRRQVQFGALPPSRAVDSLGVRGERSLTEVRFQALTTHALANDRAPPALTA